MQEYEEQIEDVDEMPGTDIKINPDYYIHNAIIKAQNCLNDPDIKIGFLKYRILVEHIESLCKAAKMINPDYETHIEAYKASEEYQKEAAETRPVIMAHKKLELIMSYVFTLKTNTNPLKA